MRNPFFIIHNSFFIRRFLFLFFLLAVVSSAHAEQKQLWFGYGNGAQKRTALGYETLETYDLAAYYPAKFAGNTISAIRFYLRNTTCIKDLKVWVSTTLPTAKDASDADVELVNVDLAKVKGGDEGDYAVGVANEIQLTAPYTITSKGIYVGYSFTVTSTDSYAGQQPMVRFMDSRHEHGFYYRTSDNMPQWTVTPEPFGDLALFVLLDGDFDENSVAPTDFAESYARLNDITTVRTTLTNNGFNPVDNLTYFVQAGNNSYGPETVSVSGLSSFGSTSSFSFTVPADNVAGTSSVILDITHVNGVPNRATSSVAQGRLCTVEKLFTQRIAVEECTGTGCMWCPRGHAGMELMRQNLGDRFVGIAIHQFNSSDPMYIDESRYYPHAFSGAPFCHLNRHGELDPFYGSLWTDDHTILDDAAPLLEDIAKVGVEVSGTWNADRSAVNATATIEALLAGKEYDVEYVLVADDLHSRAVSWMQKNAYYRTNPDSEPDALKPFCRGGKYDNANISDWHYNDVCLSSSYAGYQNQASPVFLPEAYVPVENTYTIPMTTNADVLSVLDYSKVSIIALVFDSSTYHIVNAAKAPVTDATDITTPLGTSSSAIYSLDGTRLVSPRHGINIIRTQDGGVRKEVCR